ncbi:MAG TPA: hypothetical protein VLD35_11945 [Caldimonas sp.]|nr:hypothetical protein [Caldimonas sp.]
MAGRRLSSNEVSVVIALAIVVLVLLLVYVAERGEGPREPVGAVEGGGSRAVGRDPVDRPAATTPDADAPHAAMPEGCGIESARPGQSEAEAQAVVERQREEALQAILPALEARPEARARAAGLYFRAARGLIDRSTGDACQAQPDACPTLEQRRLDDSDSAEALARLAVNSSDPQVYAWAYRSCARVSREAAGTCQLVNALQWARLDPANAAPWFAVAQEAKSRKDSAGVDDAMFHVAAATIHDPGWGRAAAEMIDAAPPANEQIVGTWLAALDALGYESLDLPSLQESSTFCQARALANANRRDLCDRIAAVLVDRSTTLLARSVGVGLAKRLDWPAEKLAATELERDAANALAGREAPRSSDSVTCANVRSDLALFVDNARLGEVEALRQRIAALGESVDTLAAEHRRIAAADREAHAARAAASAASGVSGG